MPSKMTRRGTVAPPAPPAPPASLTIATDMTRRGTVAPPAPPAPPASLTIATDAAVDRLHARYGTAHLGTDGSWGLTLRTFDGTEGEDPNAVCELRAVYHALQHIDWKQYGGALILTDSRSAEHWLHKWQGGQDGYPPAYNHKQRWPGVSHLLQLRQMVADPRLTFQWVHGHEGHPLNEFADSAAKLALRVGTGAQDGDAAKELPPRWAATRLADWFAYGAAVG